MLRFDRKATYHQDSNLIHLQRLLAALVCISYIHQKSFLSLSIKMSDNLEPIQPSRALRSRSQRQQPIPASNLSSTRKRKRVVNPPATIPDQDETQDPIFESPTSPISELDSGLISVPSSFQTDSHAAHAADPTPSKPKLFDFSFIRPRYITDGKREPLKHLANLTSPA